MQQKTFTTKNLKIASVLYALKVKLVEVHGDPSIRNDFVFTFEPFDLAEKTANQYFSGDLTIDPKELFSAMDTLKDRIFDRRDSYGTNGRS
jgi:hypothetical protein